DRSTTELRWIALADAEHTLALRFVQGKRRFRTKEKLLAKHFLLKNWLRGLDLNQRSRLRGGIMSLTIAALRGDEMIRGRLFAASNDFPIFALLKATTLHFAKP